VLERLEVQIRGPHAEGIEQHFVQELDDRRIIDFGDAGVTVFGCSVRAGLVKLEILADDAFHGIGGRGSKGFHQLGQLVILGDDPVHAHLGGKLDLFRGLLVRWIARRNKQPIVALA